MHVECLSVVVISSQKTMVELELVQMLKKRFSSLKDVQISIVVRTEMVWKVCRPFD